MLQVLSPGATIAEKVEPMRSGAQCKAIRALEVA